jgi:hypothetical protein
MHDPLQRLYRTKLALLATILLATGLALLFFGHWVQHAAGWEWIRGWPVVDIGSALFTTGLLGVALQYFDGQDSEVRATERLERVLTAAAPAMRDAVIAGFAFEPEDLARVATPETLDQVVTNGLAMRLGDPAFAADVYADIRTQAIEMPERLHDVRVSIRLSMDRGTARGRAPMFVTTVHWEYELVPLHQTRRFVCMSDLAGFSQLDRNGGATSAWYIKKRPGVDAGQRETFELVDFTVDGQSRPIRRNGKTDSQTYSVDIGRRHVEAKFLPVKVAYTYRTVTNPDGHVLQVRVDQPSQNLSVTLDYGDTDIESVRALDFIASGRSAAISRSSGTVPGKSVTVDFEGWAFARSGIAFVWTGTEAERRAGHGIRAS